MQGVRILLIVVLVAVGVALPAWAYKAEPGNRAANFRGFDIVNREAIELEDYLGQWVFVEFWATWCGPCMDELPNMLAETRPYVDSGELKVITVSGDFGEPQTYELADGPLTVPPSVIELRKVIREHNITYPVIYDGGVYDDGGDSPIPAMEWGVTSWPSSFLINPQGVIVATGLRGDKLRAGLDFYLRGKRPIVGLRSYYALNDNSTVSYFVEVQNTGREDMRLELYTYQIYPTIDPATGDYSDKVIYADELIDEAVVSFDEFCDTTHEFVFPYDESLGLLIFYLKAVVPGSKHIQGWDGEGIKLKHNGPTVFTFLLKEEEGRHFFKRCELPEYYASFAEK